MTIAAHRTTAVLAFASLAGLAAADTQKHKADASLTSSVLNGGDRELTVLRFAGSSTVLTGADFLRFNNGSLTSSAGTYSWSSLIPSDFTGGNAHGVNPDRAEGASHFDFEASHGASLEEVFGPYGSGYKNMSYLLDSEDSAEWTLDLYLAGMVISADDDTRTIELALLERGMNSNIRVSGIRADMSVTHSVMVARGNFGGVGWSVDTLESGGPQAVGAVGLSLDSSWTNLIGFRFEADHAMNGPDLIGVGVGADAAIATIPAPGSAALLGFAGLLAARRRRR